MGKALFAVGLVFTGAVIGYVLYSSFGEDRVEQFLDRDYPSL